MSEHRSFEERIENMTEVTTDVFAMFASTALGIPHSEAMERSDVKEAGQLIARAAAEKFLDGAPVFEIDLSGLPADEVLDRTVMVNVLKSRGVLIEVKGPEDE